MQANTSHDAAAPTVAPSVQAQSAITQRRADIDWLRVIAFGLLIYFHAAVVFLPQGIPMVINEQSSPLAQVFVAFLQEFRLGLLFLVSGMGVQFALRHRDMREFFTERAKRLLIPLVFGIFVLVPPMVYLEKLYIGDMPGSLLDFYAHLFDRVYPQGNLSWHHFWFVAYLFLFCVGSWPLYRSLQSTAMRGIGAWLAKGANLGAVVIVLLLAEIPLRWAFPGFRDLVNDWASFTHWWILFLAGFVFVSQPRLLDRCQALWLPAALVGLVCTGLLFANFFSFTGGSFTLLRDGIAAEEVSVIEYVTFCVLRMCNAWAWLITCVGLAGRFLQRPGVLLSYLTQAVYPLFCLHLTLSVALSYVIVRLPWPVGVKYVLITSLTLGLALMIYELMIKPNRWLRPLFGLNPLD
ncbi:MAG: acyltransferase [Pseudomonadota bacterium]